MSGLIWMYSMAMKFYPEIPAVLNSEHSDNLPQSVPYFAPIFGHGQFLQRSAEEGRVDTKIPKLRGDEKSIMRMVRILFLLPLTLLLVPMVFATAPQSGTGGFTITISNQQTHTAGGNTIITRDEVFTITGVMSGTCTGNETDVVHADGTLNGHGSCDFTGMVQERSVSGAFQFNAVNNGESFIGHFGTTHNSGIHIQGTFQPTGPTSGTYTANFHFDP